MKKIPLFILLLFFLAWGLVEIAFTFPITFTCLSKPTILWVRIVNGICFFGLIAFYKKQTSVVKGWVYERISDFSAAIIILGGVLSFIRLFSFFNPIFGVILWICIVGLIGSLTGKMKIK